MSSNADKDLAMRALERLGKDVGADLVDQSLIIPFDDFYECILTPAREGARVVMESPLLLASGVGRSELLRRAMRLNVDPSQVAGGGLYLDRETDALVMRAETPIGPEGGDGLSRAVAAFIEAARRLLERSAEGDAREPPKTETARHDVVLRG